MCMKIVIDVSGTRFSVGNGVFNKLKPSLEQSGILDKAEDEKFIYVPRHAACFQSILYYYQCGELHLPPSVCPGVFRQEMLFWNVDPQLISECCNYKYSGFIHDITDLQTFSSHASSWVVQPSSNQTPSNCGKFTFYRRKVWRTLNYPLSSLPGKIYIAIVAILVLVSICVMCIETLDITKRSLTTEELKEYLYDDFDEYFAEYGDDYENETSWIKKNNTISRDIKAHKEFMIILEYVLLGFFTFDMALRCITCPDFRTFFSAFSNILDTCALFTAYVILVVQTTVAKERYTNSYVEYLKLLNILRIARFARIMCLSKTFLVLVYSLKVSITQLGHMLILISILVVFYSSLIYVFESHEKFPSIPYSFWWAIVTMTTVGYGDDTPKSVLGKIVGSLCSLTGIVVLSMTIPLFVNNFIKYCDFAKASNILSEVPIATNGKGIMIQVTSSKVCPTEEENVKKKKRKSNQNLSNRS